MNCNPLLRMKISQDDLRAMFERNKDLAKLNPGYHMGHTKTKSIQSGLPPGGMSPSVRPPSPLPCLLINEKTFSKYRNVKVEYEGMKFDSKHELNCWKYLVSLEKAGVISGLKRQVRFELEVNGKRTGRITVDFTWMENGQYVVADAKSEITRKERSYRMQKRHFEAQYTPLTIREL